MTLFLDKTVSLTIYFGGKFKLSKRLFKEWKTSTGNQFENIAKWKEQVFLASFWDLQSSPTWSFPSSSQTASLAAAGKKRFQLSAQCRIHFSFEATGGRERIFVPPFQAWNVAYYTTSQHVDHHERRNDLTATSFFTGTHAYVNTQFLSQSALFDLFCSSCSGCQGSDQNSVFFILNRIHWSTNNNNTVKISYPDDHILNLPHLAFLSTLETQNIRKRRLQ